MKTKVRQNNALRRSLLFFGITIIPVMLIVGCGPQEEATGAFTTGIRVVTALDLGTRLGREPVPGVDNSGNLTKKLGPPGPGPQSRIGFSGTTDGFAISDYPDCVTNATWSSSVNYAKAIPACGSKTASFDIEPAGNIILWVCHA